MINELNAYVPNVIFEKIPIKNLVSSQDYQRSLSESQILRIAREFDLHQINPVKVSRRDGYNYVFDGQHTIEAVALVSGSRDTPVWCMIYDHLCYEHEAHIFAEQQKHHRSVAPFDTFNAHLESGSEKHLLIRDLVYSYNLELGSTQKRHGTICAIAALENIFDTYGYHMLDKVLRIIVSTWEGEMYSLSGNTLNAVARLIAAYGDALNEETFKERLGLIPMKTIIRTARERRPGSLGYAEAMLIFYNKKCKYRLSMRKLYGATSDEDDLDDVVGVLNTRDYLLNMRAESPKPLRDMLRPARFVPESVRADVLFRNMQIKKVHMAIVVDEYGGTAGLVTLEDILEELVGEIWDEHDEVIESFRKQEDGSYLISASADLTDLYDLFSISGECDASTVSGWVIDELGRLPQVGDHFQAEGLDVTVTQVDHRRVLEIRVAVLPEDEAKTTEETR